MLNQINDIVRLLDQILRKKEQDFGSFQKQTNALSCDDVQEYTADKNFEEFSSITRTTSPAEPPTTEIPNKYSDHEPPEEAEQNQNPQHYKNRTSDRDAVLDILKGTEKIADIQSKTLALLERQLDQMQGRMDSQIDQQNTALALLNDGVEQAKKNSAGAKTQTIISIIFAALSLLIAIAAFVLDIHSLHSANTTPSTPAKSGVIVPLPETISPSNEPPTTSQKNNSINLEFSSQDQPEEVLK